MRDSLRSLLLALLTGTLLLGSCGLAGSDGDGELPQTDSTYLRSTLNGEKEWSGKDVEVNFFNHAGLKWLTVFGNTSRGRYNETFGLSIIYEDVGSYPLIREKYEDGFNTHYTGSRFHEAELDALLASYSSTDDTSANQLTITSYDSTTGIMTGTFHTTVVVDSADRVSEPGEPPRRRPDTLRFTNGEFRAKVEDRR